MLFILYDEEKNKGKIQNAFVLSDKFEQKPCPRCGGIFISTVIKFKSLHILLFLCSFGFWAIPLLLDSLLETAVNKNIFPKYKTCGNCHFILKNV